MRLLGCLAFVLAFAVAASVSGASASTDAAGARAAGIPLPQWKPWGGVSVTASSVPSRFTLSWPGTYWGLLTHRVSGCNYVFSGQGKLESGDGWGLAVRAAVRRGVPYSGPALQYDAGLRGYRLTEYPNSEGGTVIPATIDRSWHTLRIAVHGKAYKEFVDGRLLKSGTSFASCRKAVMIRVWRSTIELRNLTVTA